VPLPLPPSLPARRYAWPRTPGLRVRVFLCVVLLFLMRVLNLAVPITYKKLVDQLADASAAPPGQRPPFITLLKPWWVGWCVWEGVQSTQCLTCSGFVEVAGQGEEAVSCACMSLESTHPLLLHACCTHSWPLPLLLLLLLSPSLSSGSCCT
jgi:hypothetical protein